jgi:hypothetical protein
MLYGRYIMSCIEGILFVLWNVYDLLNGSYVIFCKEGM